MIGKTVALCVHATLKHRTVSEKINVGLDIWRNDAFFKKK